MAGMTTKRLLVCAGCALLAGTEARAVNRAWVNNAPGTLIFQTDTNWNPVGQPTLSDNLTFAIDLAGNPILIGTTSQAFNMDFAANDWELSGAAGGTMDSNGTLTIDNGFGMSLIDAANVVVSNDLTWNNTGNIFVGNAGSGTLTIQDGSNLDGSQVFVGDGPNVLGVIDLTGDTTSLTARLDSNTGVFTIGRGGGNGTINVLDGADLRTTSTDGNDIWVGGHLDDAATQATTSIGTLNVDGAGSFVETEDLNVGIGGGIGFVNITNGGNVTLTDGGSPDAAFGTNDGFGGLQSQGFGVIDGDGSLLNARGIFVGSFGVGTLEIRNGGEARTRIDTSTPSDVIIGNLAGSTGRAAVHGFASDGTTPSLIDSEDNLIVGNAGLGILNVGLNLVDAAVGGGALQVDGNLVIGDDDGNDVDNTLRVQGADTTVNIGVDLTIGNLGRGVYEQTGGATVTVGNDFTVGLGNGSNSTALIDGAGTTLTAEFAFIGNGTGGGSTGAVTVSGGAVATFTEAANTGIGAVTLGDDGNGVGTLTVTGTGSLVQATNANGQWWIGGSVNENGGTGTAHILAGGQGIAGGRTVLGHQPTADGTLNVDGVGSVFDANGDYILIGFEGTGELNITNGGVVNATRIFVADATGSAGSTLNLDGAGSTLDIVRRLHVGDTVRGVANVTNGGQLTVGGVVSGERFIIGDEGASDGSKLTVDGAGSRVDYTGTFDIAVGNAGGSTANRATLEVTNGAVFSAVQRDNTNAITSQARIIVGDITGGNGHVIVDGPGSRVEASVMYVGDGDSSSSGILDVTNGGVVDLTGEFQGGSFGSGTGTINIDGDGSQLLAGTTFSLGDDTLGGATNGATGTLNLTDGGYVSNGAQAYIGHFTGSFGTATLGSTTANDSVWDIGGELTIAGTETSSQGSGSGTLNVNTGGVVNIASNLRVRNLGEVNIAGGTVSIGDDLILTDAGSDINFVFGKLQFASPGGKSFSPAELERILDQGGANRPTLFTNMELAVDSAAVIGGPLRILGGTLSVGTISTASFSNVDFDTGTLNITNSGLVVGSGGLLGTNATITEGQTVNVTTSTFVNAGSTFTIVGDFSSGGMVNNGDLVIIDTSGSGKTIGGSVNSPAGSTVTLLGDITFAGGITGAADFFGPGNAIFAAGFAPGDSPAEITFEGGVGFTSTATLDIELGGFTPGSQHDRLVVNGDAQLGGEIDFTLINSHMPALGDSYTVLTSAGLNGTTFDSVGNGRLIGSNLRLGVTYTQTDVVVTAVRLADLDMDGDVDDADFGVAFAAFTGPNNGPSINPTADLDGDGDVDDADFGIAFAGFTGPLSPANVPEPASLVMFAGLLGLVARRRR